MAGIAGIIHTEMQVVNLLDPMLNILKHRASGPKDIYSFQKLQIGIQGNTLFQNKNQSIIVALDGNLNNKKELCSNLNLPNTTSSAELIGTCYELWGIQKALEKMEGDFAFALFDKLKNRLILARDRLGKKPLYWFHNPHHFVFASELKALLINGLVPQTPSVDGLAAYLSLGYIPQDMSPIEGVSKLLPGHYLTFDLPISKAIHSYWSYSSYFSNNTIESPEEIAHHLENLLQQAIEKRLPDEKDIGCYIKAGIGSSSLAYYLKELTGRENVFGLSVGVNNQNDDELEAAEKIGNILNITQNTDSISPHSFTHDLAKIAWHLDEPVAEPHTPVLWKLAQLASGKTTTLFSALGNDELLGGHTRYIPIEKQKSFKNRLKHSAQPLLKSLMMPLLKWIWHPTAFQILKKTRTSSWQAEYLRKNALFNRKTIANAAPQLAKLFDPIVFLQKFHNLPHIHSTISSYVYLDVKTRLVDCYALQYDRFMAAHSVQWQAPFFDNHIVEYLAGLSNLEKIQGIDRTLYFKWLLKNVYTDDILRRPRTEKQVFSPKWLEKSDLPKLFQGLLRGTLVETGLISSEWLEDRVENIYTQSHSFHYLWAILMMELWFRLYINHPVKPNPPETPLVDLLREP